MIQQLHAMKSQNHTMKTPKLGHMMNQILMERSNLQNAKFLYLLAFLLITIALLIAVNIYCYLIKYRAKEKIFITISLFK